MQGQWCTGLCDGGSEALRGERDHSIDLLKGFAIMLVILGHIPQAQPEVKYWLYSFHIPLFFACSGMVIVPRKYTYEEFVRRRFRGIVLPYFVLGVSLYLLTFVVSTAQATQTGEVLPAFQVTSILKSLLLGNRLHWDYYSMWFLCALFLGELVYYPLACKAKDSLLGHAGIVVGCIVLQKLVFGFVNGCYWSADTVPACVAYLALGGFIRIAVKDKRWIKWRYAALFAAGNLLFGNLNAVRNGMTDLYYCSIGNPALYLASATSGVLASVIVARLIGKQPVIEYYGRNSLIVYAFQGALVIPQAVAFVEGLAKHIPLLENVHAGVFIVFVLVLMASAVLIELFKPLIALMGKSGALVRRQTSA